MIQAHLRSLSDVERAGGAGSDLRGRLAALVEAFITGYTRALWDSTLDAQDSLRLAALTAQAHAERQMRALEARLLYAALHDALTGLPNRTLFGDRLEHLLRRARTATRMGLCYIDIDDFKSVNDSLGHRVGDLLITAVADRLNTLATESGHLLARLGGDKFAFLIEDTSCADDAVKLADRRVCVGRVPDR